MTVATQLEILDIRHFSARMLRPLLEDEARIWQERLRWDYRDSIEMLLQYLDSRVLPGFVALHRGRICGYTFCVFEGHKAVIGDVFAVGEGDTIAVSTAKTLLRHLLEMLLHTPTVDRIEAQLLLYEAGVIDEVFTAAGFHLYPRRFLELQLHAGTSRNDSNWLDVPGLELYTWTEEDYNAAAELIHRAYSGHIDSQVNDQYRSLSGSHRFLHNIVRFPGCGTFDAGSSWVLREQGTKALAGIVLVSDVGEHVAHITQLCIAPLYRGRGLARRLMHHCAVRLAANDFQAITLTVTEENHSAMKVYNELGFVTRHRFAAMVYESA